MKTVKPSNLSNRAIQNLSYYVKMHSGMHSPPPTVGKCSWQADTICSVTQLSCLPAAAWRKNPADTYLYISLFPPVPPNWLARSNSFFAADILLQTHSDLLLLIAYMTSHHRTRSCVTSVVTTLFCTGHKFSNRHGARVHHNSYFGSSRWCMAREWTDTWQTPH